MKERISFTERIKDLLTNRKGVSRGGIAVLCATAILALTPAAAAPGLALLLGSMGVNVLASVLQQFYQNVGELASLDEEEHLVRLTSNLEVEMRSNKQLRHDISTFLGKEEVIQIAEAVVKGDPSVHTAFLTGIYRDLTKYGDDFRNIAIYIQEILAKLNEQRPEGLQKILMQVSGQVINLVNRRLDDNLDDNKVRNLSDHKAESITDVTTSLDIITHAIVAEIVGTNTGHIAKVRTFLLSPEFENIMRQTFVAMLEDSLNKYVSDIQEELSLLLRHHVGLEGTSCSQLSERLFEMIHATCDVSLIRAIEKGNLIAHEARSQMRHQFLADQLSVIRKNTAFLSNKRVLDVPEIARFEQKYRGQVADRHGMLLPPFIDTTKKVPIDRLYVVPTITQNTKSSDAKMLTLPQFRNRLYRAVLLGNPGGGKSTFSSKLCYDLATHYEERLVGGRPLSPILVVLREYGAMKQKQHCSILKHIQIIAESHYQLSMPEDAIEYLLLNGRVMVIFDGLDELLDTSDRQEIAADVESFCNLYPDVPVLVTSREVGYEQAPLSEFRFEVFRLAPFARREVQQYVANWFGLDNELTLDEQTQKINDFMEESEPVEDLRANPLLLGLMCNLYRGEGYIPSNRPDLYEKCAHLLFERWDKARQISLPLALESGTRDAMMHLANWIYTNGALREGVTEQKLIIETTKYLYKRRYEDEGEAHYAAQQLVEFCRGRAWVFTDIGTTPHGESLYQFTHRTFLEYFTAAYLVRTHHTVEALITVLLPRIAAQEWDIVAQLAFQILSRQVEGAGDDLLYELLLASHDADYPEMRNIIHFAVRCLAFMVPSPSIRRDITEACLSNAINAATGNDYTTLTSIDLHQQRLKTDGLLGDLLNAAPGNQATLEKYSEAFLIDKLTSGDARERLISAEITYCLPWYLLSHTNDSLEKSQPWIELSKRVITTCSEQIKHLASENKKVCFIAVDNDLVTLGDGVRWYGADWIFREPRMLSLRFSPFAAPIWSIWRPGNVEITEHMRRVKFHLTDLGSVLAALPVPWFSTNNIRIYRSTISIFRTDLRPSSRLGKRNSEASKKDYEQQWDEGALWGAFGILAGALELDVLYRTRRSGPRKNLSIEIRQNKGVFFELFMRWIFLGRIGMIKRDKIEAEIYRCSFNSERRNFIWRWINREIDLINTAIPQITEGSLGENLNIMEVVEMDDDY